MNCRVAVAMSIALCALARTGECQQLGWSGHIEASGNVLFGAARGRLLALTAGAGRADSALEAESDMLLSYADAPSDDERSRRVTARAMRLSLSADHRPFDRVTRFVFGTIESSLQQRIDRRFSGGGGAKYTFYRRKDDDVSASLALLYEHTRALETDSVTPATASRTRWSLRVRVRRQLTSAIRFTHVTFYQPAVDRFARYSTETNTSLLISINETLALSASLRDRYDSEAQGRGARSNHDGQLVFGVRASF